MNPMIFLITFIVTWFGKGKEMYGSLGTGIRLFQIASVVICLKATVALDISILTQQ